MASDYFETMREYQGNKINRGGRSRTADKPGGESPPEEGKPAPRSPNIATPEERPRRDAPPLPG